MLEVGQVVRTGQLQVPRIAGNDADNRAGGLHQRGVVGGIPTTGMRSPQHVRRKGLRRLDRKSVV